MMASNCLHFKCRLPPWKGVSQQFLVAIWLLLSLHSTSAAPRMSDPNQQTSSWIYGLCFRFWSCAAGWLTRLCLAYVNFYTDTSAQHFFESCIWVHHIKQRDAWLNPSMEKILHALLKRRIIRLFVTGCTCRMQICIGIFLLSCVRSTGPTN